MGRRGRSGRSQCGPILTTLGSGTVASCLTTYLGFIHPSCHPSIYPHVSAHSPSRLPICYPSIHPYIHSPAHPPTHLPSCSSIHPPTHPFIHPVFAENLLTHQALFQALASNQLNGARTCFTHLTGIYTFYDSMYHYSWDCYAFITVAYTWFHKT